MRKVEFKLLVWSGIALLGLVVQVTAEVQPDFVILEQMRPLDFDPLCYQAGVDYRLSTLISDGLVSLDSRSSYTSGLAVFAVRRDPPRIVFTLAPDARWRWQDGQTEEEKEITVDDVEKTIEVIKDRTNPTIRPELRAKLNEEERLERDVRDSRRFTVYLRHEVADPLWVMDFGLVPASHADFQAGSQYRESAGFHSHPVGVGRYRMVDSDGGDVVLRANHGHMNAPKIETVRVRAIEDPVLYVRNLLGLKSVTAAVQVPAELLPDVQADTSLAIYPYGVNTFCALIINCRRAQLPQLAEPEVRMALAKAIDRDFIVQSIYSGYATVTSGPFAPGSWAYNPNLDGDRNPQAYSRADAEAVLRKLHLSLTLLAPVEGMNAQAGLRRAVLKIVENLRTVGVEVQLEERTRDMQTKRMEIGDFDIGFHQWTFNEAVDISYLFHSNPDIGTLNWGKFHSEAVDKKLDELRSTDDYLQKRVINWELHEMLSQQAAYVFLWAPNAVAAVRRNVHVTGLHPFDFFRYFHDWSWVAQ